MSKQKKWHRCIFKILRPIVKWIYPKTEIEGWEHVPDKDVIVVGNHTQMNGPLVGEFYFPDNYYTWCAGEMMHLEKVPAYAFEDFWSHKKAPSRWFYKLASYLIAPLSVVVFNNARAIGVYHDIKILSTFRKTVSMLEEGNNIVIFPEHDEYHNHIVSEFTQNFVDVAKMYYKKTGRRISFVPVYIAPYLKKAYFSKPVEFCETNPIEEERARICNYLMDEITNIACSLPKHTVVPYKNVSKKEYPQNILEKGETNEKN